MYARSGLPALLTAPRSGGLDGAGEAREEHGLRRDGVLDLGAAGGRRQ